MNIIFTLTILNMDEIFSHSDYKKIYMYSTHTHARTHIYRRLTALFPELPG